jgi:hypothetical protein
MQNESRGVTIDAWLHCPCLDGIISLIFEAGQYNQEAVKNLKKSRIYDCK